MGEDCTIRISGPAVSRTHALVSYQYEKFILKDLWSKSGTWMNNEKIRRRNLNHIVGLFWGVQNLFFFSNVQIRMFSDNPETILHFLCFLIVFQENISLEKDSGITSNIKW
jgi:pSer/pThr/pTyr-binding forkhead associated (FHA) protein